METDIDRWLKVRDEAAQGQGTWHMGDSGLYTGLQGAPHSILPTAIPTR